MFVIVRNLVEVYRDKAIDRVKITVHIFMPNGLNNNTAIIPKIAKKDIENANTAAALKRSVSFFIGIVNYKTFFLYYK